MISSRSGWLLELLTELTKKDKNVKVNKGERIDNSADWRILRIWVLCGRDIWPGGRAGGKKKVG